ncbi:hypothetical protein GCM10028816_14380 [Spirosoma lituiforme]
MSSAVVNHEIKSNEPTNRGLASNGTEASDRNGTAMADHAMADHVTVSSATVDSVNHETANNGMVASEQMNRATAIHGTVPKISGTIAMANHAMANHEMANHELVSNATASSVTRTTAKIAMLNQLIRGQHRLIARHQLTGQTGGNGKTISGLNSSARVSQTRALDLPRTGNAMSLRPIGTGRQLIIGAASAIQTQQTLNPLRIRTNQGS